jgi:hypothetical protein
MRKPIDNQRPLLSPYVAWEQLPDTVREQALNVLIALYIESTDATSIIDNRIDTLAIVQDAQSTRRGAESP